MPDISYLFNQPVKTATHPYNDIERLVIERVNDKNDFVIMRVNPQRISVRRQKVIQRIQTSTRWVFQHWGAEPITIAYNGVTGYINAEGANYQGRNSYTEIHNAGEIWNSKFASPASSGKISPYDTPAYRALARLREFYETPHTQLQGQDLTTISGKDTDERLKQLCLNLYYRDSLFTGYLMRMEIQEEENNPWMWSYTMEFIAYKHQDNPFIGYGAEKKVMDVLGVMKDKIPGDPNWFTGITKSASPGITRAPQLPTPARWKGYPNVPTQGLSNRVTASEVIRTNTPYQGDLPRKKEL